MWDLSSLPRDWTHIPCIARWVLNHWSPREVPRCSSHKMLWPPMEPGQTLCCNLNILFLIACDDDCVGVLLNDLAHVGDAILSVNLTSTIPLPYGVLSDLENRTKSLRVGTANTRWIEACVTGSWRVGWDPRGHSVCPPPMQECWDVPSLLPLNLTEVALSTWLLVSPCNSPDCSRLDPQMPPVYKFFLFAPPATLWNKTRSTRPCL